MHDAIGIFDAARSTVLRTAMRTELAPVLRSRDRRAAFRASTAIVIAFAFAWIAPAWALALSPLILGVPHIASAVRYLVLRQSFSRLTKGLIVFASLVLLGFRAFEQYGSAVHFAARMEVSCGVLWGVAAAIAGARAARAPWRLAISLPLMVAVGIFGLQHPTWVRLAFIHVHNLGAVVAWLLLFRRRRALLPLGLLAFFLLLLSSGMITPILPAGMGVDVEMVGRWLAPGLATSIAVPLVLAHVFTDSVHYAFWIGVIPEETLRGEGSLTFRMTWLGLRRDFGTVGLWMIGGLMAALAVFAFFGAARARDVYFAVAGFHGYLEGAMVVYLVSAYRSSASTRSNVDPIAAELPAIGRPNADRRPSTAEF